MLSAIYVHFGKNLVKGLKFMHEVNEAIQVNNSIFRSANK